MTSTVLQHQQPQQQHTTAPPPKTPNAMAWSNEKLRFSCIDNIGLKQLWRLIALDTSSNATATTGKKAKTNMIIVDKAQQQQQQQQHENQQSPPPQHENANLKQHVLNNNNNNNSSANNNNHNENVGFEDCENVADYLTNRDILPPSHMSLLKFLAINALELSAPATPALLQSNQNVRPSKPCSGWMQLSGHPESVVPSASGVVRKRVASLTDSEVLSYQQIAAEPHTASIVPHFYGTLQTPGGEPCIELQDLLAGFKDPCVMDIKMGTRTFLESEVANKTLRPDLYQKMIAVDPLAPTADEHAAAAITKLRYMLFREAMSSSQSKGFRIEAIRLRGRPPMKDLKTVRTPEQIQQTIEQFVGGRRGVQKDLIKRLKQMRSVIERSEFFRRHEIVGSSIFIVYDDDKMGAWLIDFAKSRQLPAGMTVNHRSEWVPGNREEGLLKGLDELIVAFEDDYARVASRRCLQI